MRRPPPAGLWAARSVGRPQYQCQKLCVGDSHCRHCEVRGQQGRSDRLHEVWCKNCLERKAMGLVRTPYPPEVMLISAEAEVSIKYFSLNLVIILICGEAETLHYRSDCRATPGIFFLA
jgi:hypothetical protein